MEVAQKPSLHARLAAGRVDSAIVEAVDSLIAPDPYAGPMRSEVLDPLVAVGGQIARLRDGDLGPLTVEQRQALNLIHGRLSHIALLLSELHDGTALAEHGVQPALQASATD